MKITIEAAENEHAMFRIRVNERFVGGVMTAAQAELIAGDILRHRAMPGVRRGYLPVDALHPHVAKRAPDSLWALPDQDEAWAEAPPALEPELPHPAVSSNPPLSGGWSREVLGHAKRLLRLRHLLSHDRRQALSR